MRESSTYQQVLVEGRVAEAKELLLELGTQRFGSPDPRTSALLTALDDHARLRALAHRLYQIASWSELLASP
jgi:hypothetical protein